MPTAVGETCSLLLTLTDDDIRAGAARVHDLNPIHHDLAAARAAGYPGLVASGAHTGAIFMGITATHFSAPYVSAPYVSAQDLSAPDLPAPNLSTPTPAGRERRMLGLGFEFRFRAPVFAHEPLTMRWVVRRGAWKPSLAGWVIDADGSVETPRGTALAGTTQFLLRTPTLSGDPHDAPQ